MKSRLGSFESLAIQSLVYSTLAIGVVAHVRKAEQEREKDPLSWDIAHRDYKRALETYEALSASLKKARDYRALFHLSQGGLNALGNPSSREGLELKIEFQLGKAESFARTDSSFERGVLMFSNYFDALLTAQSSGNTKLRNWVLTELITGASSERYHPQAREQYRAALNMRNHTQQRQIERLLLGYMRRAQEHAHLRPQVDQSRNVYQLPH